MSLIYKPKGRAGEYASLALNYYNGCSHRCSYCFCESIVPGFTNKRMVEPRSSFTLQRLRDEVAMSPPQEEVLLCFMGDPYCPEEREQKITREVLKIFLEFKAPVRILTKGGTRCLRDMDLFSRFVSENISIAVGQSLTFIRPEDSHRWEPGAACPADRLEALEILHSGGIPTWASFEPVIDPIQSLTLMEDGLAFIDEYKIGPVNHRPELQEAVDWKAFGRETKRLLDNAGKRYVLKKDLIRLMGA